MRDFQRKRVYRWEKEVLWNHPNNWKFDTLSECHVFIEKIWLVERSKFFTKITPVPRLGDDRSRRSAVSLGGEIRLPRFARTAVIICHEVAHELLPRDVGHTEDWVSIFINLLNTNLNISKDAMIETTMDFKIKINHDLL